jgi:uncharacterized protein
MKALILTDGKAGHENQSVALCRHLGFDYEKLTVSYFWKPGKALSYLLDRLGLYTDKLFHCPLPSAPCSLLISTGSTTYYPNKVLARRLGIPNIAIMHPNGYRLNFTKILCPAYDHPPKHASIIELPLNLCAADPAFFREKSDEFTAKHTSKKPSAAGFIIGGPNAVSTLDAERIRNQLQQAFALTGGCERWVTTSRRTPPDVEAVIEALPFDYRLINSRDPYNPVPAFIQLCDRLFVTSDSASMISECASFGTAAVEVLMNRQTKTPNKFEEFLQGLEKRNAVHIFDGTLGTANLKIDLSALLKEKLKPLIDDKIPAKTTYN